MRLCVLVLGWAAVTALASKVAAAPAIIPLLAM